MAKEFNITGVCVPHRHYIVDISKKITNILKLVDNGKYFSICRPRQYGKTTTLFNLNKALLLDKNYICIKTSFEGLGVDAYENAETFIPQFLSLLNSFFRQQKLTLLSDFISNYAQIKKFEQLGIFITDLVLLADKKIVLLIDEVDKSMNNQLFIDFLAMLRNKYLNAMEDNDSTFHSVVLVGVHDVRAMKLKINPNTEHKYNSPWNIAADFDIDMSFNSEEISTMLVDYSKDKNIEMDIKTISQRIYHYTSGYPFLVSKICKEIDEKILPNKQELNWTINDVEEAVKKIVRQSNTNFESLVKHLEENAEILKYVENIVAGNIIYSFNNLFPVIYMGVTHGIFKNYNQKVVISNHIYEHILTEYITSKLESEGTISKDVVQSTYIKPNKRLNIEKILLKFQEVIKEKYSQTEVLKSNEFLEKDLRLLFLVFIKPIINGIGFTFKEVEIGEEKRLDVVILFADEKFVVELKLWRGNEYHIEGKERLKKYMQTEGVDKSYMLIMDKTKHKEFTSYIEDDILMVWV